MANVIADGSILSIGSTLATAVAMSAISNAAEAVATLGGGHGSVVGDFLQIASGWPSLDGKVLRVKTVVTNDVTLEGFSTLDTGVFPAGGGVGTSQRITVFTNIAQIVGFTTEGGEQNYDDFQYLNETQQRRVPTNKSPLVANIELADDITLSQMAILRTAETLATPRPMRIIFRNGSRTVASGFWSMANMAKIELGKANKRSLVCALACIPQEYAT